MRLAKVIGLASVVAAVVATAASAFHVADAPPPDGVVGIPYSFLFEPKDGAPPYSFEFFGGDLPPGLKIESGGLFHGIPTTPGTFNFDVNATQYCAPDPACESQRSFTVKIRDSLAITTPALKSAGVGSPYSMPISVTGSGGLGLGWKISAGSLPAGLTLAPEGTPADGVISGTPTAIGTSTFTVKVGDTDGFVPDRATTKQFTIAVVAPLAVQTAPAPLPTGIVGKPYKGQPATATGGAAPYTWSLAGGVIPPGLGVDPATGALIGTPTAAGAFSFTIGVADAGGRTATTPATVTVVQALDVVTSRLRNARVGHSYKTTLHASGGLLPRTWKLKRGKLPAGLRLNGQTGVLSGTARKAGTFRFAVTVTDALGQRSSEPLALTVKP